MVTITAVLTCTDGNESVLRTALLSVAGYAREHEPGTVSYYATQDLTNPRRFTTYERYQSEAAMAEHNSSAAVAEFFRIAVPILAEPALVITGAEL